MCGSGVIRDLIFTVIAGTKKLRTTSASQPYSSYGNCIPVGYISRKRGRERGGKCAVSGFGGFCPKRVINRKFSASRNRTPNRIMKLNSSRP